MKSPAPEIRPLVTPFINKGCVSSFFEYHDNGFDDVVKDRLLVVTPGKSRGRCSTARQPTLRVNQTRRSHILFDTENNKSQSLHELQRHWIKLKRVSIDKFEALMRLKEMSLRDRLVRAEKISYGSRVPFLLRPPAPSFRT